MAVNEIFSHNTDSNYDDNSKKKALIITMSMTKITIKTMTIRIKTIRTMITL